MEDNWHVSFLCKKKRRKKRPFGYVQSEIKINIKKRKNQHDNNRVFMRSRWFSLTMTHFQSDIEFQQNNESDIALGIFLL